MRLSDAVNSAHEHFLVAVKLIV